MFRNSDATTIYFKNIWARVFNNQASNRPKKILCLLSIYLALHFSLTQAAIVFSVELLYIWRYIYIYSSNIRSSLETYCVGKTAVLNVGNKWTQIWIKENALNFFAIMPLMTKHTGVYKINSPILTEKWTEIYMRAPLFFPNHQLNNSDSTRSSNRTE